MPTLLASLGNPSYFISPGDCAFLGYFFPTVAAMCQISYLVPKFLRSRPKIQFHLSHIILAQFGIGACVGLLLFAARHLTKIFVEMDVGEVGQTVNWSPLNALGIAAIWFVVGLLTGLMFVDPAKQNRILLIAELISLGGSSLWLSLLAFNAMTGIM